MKTNKTPLILSLIVLLLTGSMVFAAAAGSPGSEDDPVVTKSYVDEKIRELKNAGTSSSGTETAAVFRVVEVEAGKKVLGGEGTEMILRGGEALALDNGVNGISDLTAGADLRKGTTVALNHLLLIPLDDGRGIEIKTKAWVMIKGDYTIQ